MNVIPLGNHVVVRVLEAEIAADQIVLPQPNPSQPCEGRVLSVGDGQMLANGSRSAPQVREGDRVLFPRGVGTELDQHVVVLGETDILATLA